ncbi:MAG: response regulator [Clostridium sp.]|nr:response regulator [Clostridium sp.]MCM1170921.1 response regulator [Clostridium sp.]MCM1207355.1 response regulator [Ruminococcus sp.]
MKKALLIGKFNTVFKDLYDFFDEKDQFIHIQVCPEHIESIKSIIKMTNPGLIIISLISLDKEYQTLFAFIRQKYEDLPVLCIGTESEQKPFEAFLETAQYQAITRPCTNRNIWTHVKAILDISEKPTKLVEKSEEDLERELEEKIGRRMEEKQEEQEKRTVTFRDNRQNSIEDDLDDSWIDEALAKQTKAAYQAKIMPKTEATPAVKAAPQATQTPVASATTPQPKVEEALPPISKKIRVLLVDDNPIQLRALRSALMKDYEVLMAVSGEESIEVMNDEHPDIVFLDYTMPGYNGKQVLETVRKSENLKNMPVVFLTGLQDKKEIMSLVALKPNGYLVKPPDVDVIKNTIQKLVG